MKRKRPTLTEQVRQAIADCGQSRNAISKATGIDPATLCRFMHRKGGLSNPILDTLGEYLDLRIVAGNPRKSKTKGR